MTACCPTPWCCSWRNRGPLPGCAITNGALSAAERPTQPSGWIVRPRRRRPSKAADDELAVAVRRQEDGETIEKGSDIWAQLITMRLKPDNDTDLAALIKQLQTAEQPDSGLVRSTAMRDQKDPDRVCFLVVFESEEKARAREQDPARQEALQRARSMMADMFDGPPEFVDLSVVAETVGQ